MPCRAAFWPEPSPGWSAAASAATTCWPTCSARSTVVRKVQRRTAGERHPAPGKSRLAGRPTGTAPQNRQTDPRSRRAPQKLQPQNPEKTDETSPTKKRPVLLPLLLLTAAGCATTRTTTQTSDIQTRIHSERSVEKSQRDSLVRQLRQQQQESDSTSRTLLIATESLPTDRTRLAIPLKDLERLPRVRPTPPAADGPRSEPKTGRFAHRHRYKRPSGTAYMAADKPDFPAAAAIGQPRKPYRSAKPFLLRPRYDPPA